MILKRYSGFALLALACAAGSYLATTSWSQDAPPTPPSVKAVVGPRSVADWLDLGPQQTAEVRALSAAFAADRTVLEGKLETERERLAALFDRVDANREEILQQVERVIEAHDALERRIAEHLIDLRPHLTAAQQQRLFQSFAGSVREGCGRWRWREGKPAGEKCAGESGVGSGPCRRQGKGQGQGPPPGRGWRRNEPTPPPTQDDAHK